MSILDQQSKMSLAMTSGRSIEGQAGANWVSKNVTTSQLRSSDRESDLVSGYFPGGEGVRDPYMYPDNNSVILGGGLNVISGSIQSHTVSSLNGIENIKDSRTAAKLG